MIRPLNVVRRIDGLSNQPRVLLRKYNTVRLTPGQKRQKIRYHRRKARDQEIFEQTPEYLRTGDRKSVV